MKKIIVNILLLLGFSLEGQEIGNHALELRLGLGTNFLLNTKSIDNILVRYDLPEINSLPIFTANVEFNYWYKNFGISVGELVYSYTDYNPNKSVRLNGNVVTYMFKFMYKVLKTDYFEIVPYIGFFDTYGEFSFYSTVDNSIDNIIQNNLPKLPSLKREEPGFVGGLLFNYKIYQGSMVDILLGMDVIYIHGLSGKDSDVTYSPKWILNTYQVRDNSSLSNINTSINIGFRYKI